MAEEREVNTPSGRVEKFDFLNMNDDQLHALAVEILELGVSYSRFNVELPPDVHGEWVPRDALAVREYQLMGFEVDKKYANENAVKSQSGLDGNVIGDVIFMTCPMKWKEILDAEKHKRFVAMNGRPGDDSVGEEKSYLNEANKLKKFGIGTIVASRTQNVPATEMNKT